MMKPGFMLIELIVATLVASMVAAILLAALGQSNRFQMIDDNLIDMSTRIAVISNQLEKDLMGAFIPMQAEEKKESFAKATEDKQAVKNEQSTTESKETEQKSAQNVPAKEKPKPIEKIFYSTQKNGQLDTLTFITNNPLVVYVGADVGVVKPKVARVQYTLKPEAEKKDSYALFRQESTELDLEKYKNVTAYEVIGGIKKCMVTFTARIPKKSAEASAAAGSANASEKKSYEYKTQPEWVSEQKKESSSGEATKDKSEFPRIPYSVEMKLILWDIQEKKEKEFTIVCEIPTDFSPIKQQDKDKKEPEKPKKEDKSAEQPVDQVPFAPSFAKASAGGPKVASNATEVIRLVDRATGKVYEVEKNETTMNEIMKMLGRT